MDKIDFMEKNYGLFFEFLCIKRKAFPFEKLQKQPIVSLYKIDILGKFRKTNKKTLLPAPLFNKVVGVQSVTFLKRNSDTGVFL